MMMGTVRTLIVVCGNHACLRFWVYRVFVAASVLLCFCGWWLFVVMAPRCDVCRCQCRFRQLDHVGSVVCGNHVRLRFEVCV